jgi:hypothetical protein
VSGPREHWNDDGDAPPPRRFGIGCLIALIVSAIGVVVAAVLVVRALGQAFSGTSM